MNDQLQEIEARWAKVTPGPRWPAADNTLVVGSGKEPTNQVALVSTEIDRNAIAAAPEDIAWLIAENKKLKQELKAATDFYEQTQKCRHDVLGWDEGLDVVRMR